MFENIKKDGQNTIISNDTYEVRITPKIYGGYILTKTIAENPLEIIEVRDIRLSLTEKEILKEAKGFLKQTYECEGSSGLKAQTT